MKQTVGILGGSGYVGGELLRILIKHPGVEITQVTSKSYQGRFVHSVHPNLRGYTNLKFSALEEIQPCDVLFCALPHGKLRPHLKEFADQAGMLIDLSADFRISDPDLRSSYYGDPGGSEGFVYGIPELHRDALRSTNRATGAGCLATAAVLGLFPLIAEGIIQEGPIVIEAKAGSSAGGNAVSLATHHPERHGVIRSYAPTGHRHEAELIEQLSLVSSSPFTPSDIHFSATAVERVRGVLVTAHCFPALPISERDLWGIYRRYYQDEPFMGIVKESRGIYRYPDPKILSGTNRCDVGFAVDSRTGRIVVMSALDNLMKGAAGNGVQAMNVMCGFDEREGLDFIGLHP